MNATLNQNNTYYFVFSFEDKRLTADSVKDLIQKKWKVTEIEKKKNGNFLVTIDCFGHLFLATVCNYFAREGFAVVGRNRLVGE